MLTGCVCVCPAALMSGGGVLMRRLWAVVFRVREVVVQVFVTVITHTVHWANDRAYMTTFKEKHLLCFGVFVTKMASRA